VLGRAELLRMVAEMRLAQPATPIGYMPRDQYDFLSRGTGINTRIEALPQEPFVVPIYAAPQ